jgi:hypothetical protein
MKKKVLILGYYHRDNLGDDVFEFVFNKFFKKNIDPNLIEYDIKNLDDIDKIDPDTDLILFGGGDLINDYFIDKLSKFNTPKICPTYAISIGIPYPQLIDKGYLDNFDFITHRNQTDNARLVKIYGKHRVKHFPDFSMLLPKYLENENNKDNKTINTYLPKLNHSKSKRIGVCLSRSIYSPKDPSKYDAIVEQLSVFFLKIANIKHQSLLDRLSCTHTEEGDGRGRCVYEIVFIPFCTDSNPNQNDNNINRDIYECIQTFGDYENIKMVTDKIPIIDIIDIFSSFDYTICTRFHAHVFSILTCTPVLSIFSSRKVENLLEEVNLIDYAYKMEVDKEFLYPLRVDVDELMYKFEHLVDNRYNVIQEYQSFNRLNREKMDSFETLLQNLVYYPVTHHSSSELDEIAHQKSAEVIKSIIKYYNNTHNYDNPIVLAEEDISVFAHMDGGIKELMKIMNVYPIENGENDKGDEKTILCVLAEIISFVTTRNIHTSYNYGIEQHVLSDEYNLFDACKWILEHYQCEHTTMYDNLDNKIPFRFRKLNMNYLVQHELKGYHRSGWNFILQNLQKLHTPQPSAPIFDSYLDKTFGWDHDFLSHIGFLPYRKDWSGVFHHTPNEEYSEHNLINVFNKPNFIESLGFCKMLIVFSTYLKNWIRSQLEYLEIYNVPVIMIRHPTQRVDKCLRFKYSKYKANKDKKIIHIGAWLRNTYSIYELDAPDRFKKCALKGKAMENYFVEPHIIDEMEKCMIVHSSNSQELITSGGTNCVVETPKKSINKYIAGLIKSIRNEYDNVEIIEMLSNESYDKILTKNIVFIDLVDASAVNTLIECIVRNTPILINRLPATEEYLGCDYPLFYKDLEHAKELIEDDCLIYKAYKYLKRLDKREYDIMNFISKLVFSEPYASINC